MKTITLRVLGLAGLVLFGLLFSITFLSVEQIEQSAQGFVKAQIEKEIRNKYQSATQSSLAESALNLADQLGFEKQNIQDQLNDDLPEKIANIVASLCGYDCEKKKAVAKSITAGYLERIKNINIAEQTLGNIVKGKYLEILTNLKIDLRIFLGTNCVMFLVLLLVSFMKPQAVTHLFLPGILLFVATLISSAIYVFGQDWFYTLIYNDYMGYGYLVYLSIIFAALMDIVFNQARITTEIINAILELLGSVASVSPC